jgi:hypothetical protein
MDLKVVREQSIQPTTSSERTQEQNYFYNLFAGLENASEQEQESRTAEAVAVLETLHSQDLLNLIPELVKHAESNQQIYSRQDLKDVIQAGKSKDILELIPSYISALAAVASALLTWKMRRSSKKREQEESDPSQQSENIIEPGQTQAFQVYNILLEINQEIKIFENALQSFVRSLEEKALSDRLPDNRRNLSVSAASLLDSAAKRLSELTNAIDLIDPKLATHQIKSIEEIVKQIQTVKNVVLYIASNTAPTGTSYNNVALRNALEKMESKQDVSIIRNSDAFRRFVLESTEHYSMMKQGVQQYLSVLNEVFPSSQSSR